jgi:hypothetical protein
MSNFDAYMHSLKKFQRWPFTSDFARSMQDDISDGRIGSAMTFQESFDKDSIDGNNKGSRWLQNLHNGLFERLIFQQFRKRYRDIDLSQLML